MAPEIEIVHEEPRHYVGVRRVVKPDGIGPACADILPRVFRWLAGKGIPPAGPPATIYHSVNREAGDFDIQPCAFVAEPVTPEGDLEAGSTAGGRILVATHVGPYDTLGDTWHALFARAREMGCSITRSSWEIYVDDPAEVEAERLRTRIFVPIEEE